MKIALTLVLTTLLVSLCVGGILAEDRRAKTTDGKEVLLRADGTWSYIGEYNKDKKSEIAYTGKRGTFAIHLVPNTWKKNDKVDNDAAEVGFIKDGDIYAMIIAERIEVPIEALKKAAIENMKMVDKNTKIVFEEKRTVNGKEMICLTLEVTTEGVPFTFHGYIYTGDEGSFQIVTWTGRKLFKEVKPEMEAFLNGFVILKKKD